MNARAWTYPLWATTAVSTLAATALALWYAPVESPAGVVPKLFYIHVPAAIIMFFACFLAFLAGLIYLWQRRSPWDTIALAGAELAAASSAIVLITGMLWGHLAWRQWWTWSPRLTFSLILWLLYVLFLAFRPMIVSPQRRALLSSLYLVIAFLDVPLVYLSVKLLPDIHPATIALVPAMRVTLYVSTFAAALLSASFLLAACVRRPSASAPVPPSAAPPTMRVA